MIEEVGAMVHFLPPYSPDFMSIELAISKVKTSLKMDGLEDAILSTTRHHSVPLAS